MSLLIQSILECLTGRCPSEKVRVDNMVNNKKYQLDLKENKARTAQDLATEIINTLYSAEKKGRDLEQALNDIVTEYGWTENLGVAILNALESAIKAGTAMSQVMKDAFDKATEAAIGFARDHPVYCTIIALGILVLLVPWVIEAIGFAELGPVQGSYAAAWQSRYLGYVPKGSLFSFFQRLGMVWKLELPKQTLA